MDQPWGLSGPQFLLVFVVLVALSLSPYLWARAAHRRAARLATPVPPDVDLYEKAYLVDGPKRAALTALVAMTEAERVRVLEDGRVEPVEGGIGRPHPVEQAVVTAVRSGPGQKAGSVVSQVERGPEVRALAPALERTGLLLTREERGRFRRRLLPLVAVLALGVLRLVNGLALGRPVTFLVLLLVAAGVLLLVLAAAVPRRSPVGDALVRLWSAEQAAARSPEPAAGGIVTGNVVGGLGLGLAAGVAVLGVTALGEDPMIMALRAGGAVPAPGSGGGDGGGGCGGGGCGGGGCGG